MTELPRYNGDTFNNEAHMPNPALEVKIETGDVDLNTNYSPDASLKAKLAQLDETRQALWRHVDLDQVAIGIGTIFEIAGKVMDKEGRSDAVRLGGVVLKYSGRAFAGVGALDGLWNMAKVAGTKVEEVVAKEDHNLLKQRFNLPHE